MSTWNGIRNKLENDYLCPALRGHIQYFATSYWESHDQTGRAAIRLDGVEVLRSNYYVFFVKYFSLKKASEFPFFSKGFSLPSAGIMHPCA